MTHSDLRSRVREEVIRALQRSIPTTQQRPDPPLAPSSSGKMLTMLLTGRTPLSQDFLSQAAELRLRGHVLGVVLSFSFKRFYSPDEILRTLPQGTVHLDSHCEREWQPLLEASDALLVPFVSANTAAKVTAGIEDSLPTFILLAHLRAGKPVISCPDIAQLAATLRERLAAAAPALAHTAERNFHALQQLGVQFVPVAGVAAAVARAFHVEPNETPQRLARSRPSPKREFITAEDVITAAKAGLKTLTHARDAIVTAEARDHAARLGLALDAV